MNAVDLTQSQFLTHLDYRENESELAMPRALESESRFFAAKDKIDWVLGILLLVPALPLLGLLILIIRLSSRGPGVFRQTRVGRFGQIFTMYKLRTMRTDAEAATGPIWSNGSWDARVTKLGYWLRRLHLDELPQLINVIRGEMSLVGPRPERPEFVSVLSDEIPDYLSRITVKPGITGLAQINLPPDSDLNSVRCKLVLDREYIQSAGLLLDLRILFCTALRAAGIPGGVGVEMMGLRRHVSVPAAEAASTSVALVERTNSQAARAVQLRAYNSTGPMQQ